MIDVTLTQSGKWSRINQLAYLESSTTSARSIGLGNYGLIPKKVLIG